jgi:hypothetical protein
MAQISLYIDDTTAGKLNEAAQATDCSVSKYVAAIVTRHLSEEETEEIRKKKLLRELRGALNDSFFEEPAEISWENDIPRRFDLL